MELLRRALLVGCLLPGLWLLRLAPLDPLLTVVPVDFAAWQKEEAAAVPEEKKTETQRRNALLPLPVYVEERLEYNVFSGVGPEWDRVLRRIDAVQQGQPCFVFFRPDEEPIRAVLDKLAAGGGTTYVSFSRPGGDVHYRVDRRAWTREDFRPGAGFTGKPTPPAPLFYPFRVLGLASALAGIAFFALVPGSRGAAARTRPTARELAALAASLVLFAIPLVAVGGSVQALTQGVFFTLPCWAIAAVALHLFASPGRNAPDPPAVRALFLREGLALLAIALGPLAFLVSASMILWDR